MPSAPHIHERLQQLASLDPTFQAFGAAEHQYQLNPCLNIQDIRAIESQYGIQLPEDYVWFLSQVGNGGAGPFYGLYAIEDSVEVHTDFGSPMSLNTPFPLTQAALPDETLLSLLEDQLEAAQEAGDEDLETELYEQYQALLFPAEWANGYLHLCDYGCGISFFLVITGEDAGTVWENSAVDAAGLMPSTEFGNTVKLGFLEWYQLWLGQALANLGKMD